VCEFEREREREAKEEKERERETHSTMGETQSRNGNGGYQRTGEACKGRYIMTFNARGKQVTLYAFYCQQILPKPQYCFSM
jgi:hypothetical protein